MKAQVQQQKAQETVQPKAEKQASVNEILAGYNSPLQRKAIEDEELLQKKENNTGLPDNLKSGVENLSGYAMDDVKVHYNSSQPNELNAHAYAQGSDIHLAPGQEKHLPHEAWHVVQQKQGRVKPTMQMKGKVNVNDDAGLENEADVMGAKATARSYSNENSGKESKGITNSITQLKLNFNGDSRYLDYNSKLLPDKFYNATYNATVLGAKLLPETIQVIESGSIQSGATASYNPKDKSISVRPSTHQNYKDDPSAYQQSASSELSSFAHEVEHALDHQRGVVPYVGDTVDNKENILRTEWRAWAVEAAVTKRNMNDKITVPGNQQLLVEDFEKLSAGIPDSETLWKDKGKFMTRTKKYINDNLQYSEKGEYLNFLERRVDWLREAIDYYMLNLEYD